MSSFQRARESLGVRLRELRQDAHLTGRALATQAGWVGSKVSKIEQGQQTPTTADLETWAQICGQPHRIPDLTAALRSLEEMYVEHRRMFRTGLPSRQQSIAAIENATTLTRNFEPAVVPGLLQTAEYAKARFAEGDEGDEDRGVPRSEAELEEAVAARMQRQQVLYRPGKMFHFVITEAVTRSLVCPAEVMAGQLGHLISMTTLQTIRLGVLPFDAECHTPPLHGFFIYDTDSVLVELYTAELTITNGAEIATYLRVFNRLANAAAYGAEARTLLQHALEHRTSHQGLRRGRSGRA